MKLPSARIVIIFLIVLGIVAGILWKSHANASQPLVTNSLSNMKEGDWVYVGTTSKARISVDRAHMYVGEDNGALHWKAESTGTDTDIAIVYLITEFDCIEHKRKDWKTLAIMRNGEIEVTKEQEWDVVPKDSAIDTLMSIVCQ